MLQERKLELIKESEKTKSDSDSKSTNKETNPDDITKIKVR